CGDAPASDTPPAPEATPELTPAVTPEPEGDKEDEKTFAFTRENMPRMDGSTSLVPLSQAAAGLLLGESREDVESLVQFNRTSQSYRNLMWNQCDILIASVPSADVYEELESFNFRYEMAPIATDALIFVVNEGNLVDNLTTEQIIGIYTGEITNWSEVGGADEPIAAFQRNSGAGSQALMEKLVMGDTPMMTPPTELMAGSMGELMEYVRSYDNSAGAIGYSVYYYANDMRMAEGLKIIAVDGVEPTDENIRTGAYPHLSNYYTVIGADEAEDSPARVMFEWLQSAEGQRLVQSEGYVPVKSEEDFDSLATASGFLVATHPEALGTVNTPEAKYSRLSEEKIEVLAARDDYGGLHPFVGLVNYSEWNGSNPVYGLFDAQGRIVCDPVYSEVSRLSYWGSGQEQYVPALLLGRSVEGEMRYSFSTLDGCFVSPEYSSVRGCNLGIICSNGYGDPDFVIYDFGGNIIFRGSDMKLNGLRFESIDDTDGSYMLVWLDDGSGSKAYVMDMEGNITAGPWESAEFARDQRIIATLSFDYPSTGLADCSGNWIIQPKYRHLTEHRM
ncbi:MAG: substrate-binding domain-containing protein, partial [Akkermansia sp.]|nr:substrate-binding domain-containing protein [Akkermansia sp.]